MLKVFCAKEKKDLKIYAFPSRINYFWFQEMEFVGYYSELSAESWVE